MANTADGTILEVVFDDKDPNLTPEWARGVILKVSQSRAWPEGVTSDILGRLDLLRDAWDDGWLDIGNNVTKKRWFELLTASIREANPPGADKLIAAFTTVGQVSRAARNRNLEEAAVSNAVIGAASDTRAGIQTTGAVARSGADLASGGAALLQGVAKGVENDPAAAFGAGKALGLAALAALIVWKVL